MPAAGNGGGHFFAGWTPRIEDTALPCRRVGTNRARRRPLHLAIRHWPAPVRLSIAIVCLIIGIAGFVLPILPGWPFFFVALAILTTLFPGLQRAWHRYLRRRPKLRNRLKKFRRSRPGD